MTLPTSSIRIRQHRRVPGRVGAAAAPAASDLFETLEPRQLLATFVVANLADAGAGSLRQAVLDANAAPGADVIDFLPGVTGTITLGGTQIGVSDDLTINGPGAGVITVSGNNLSRVFAFTSGTSTLSGLTITGGSGYGGGIYSLQSTLTITNSTISGNTSATDAGGIYGFRSTLTITGSTISQNSTGAAGFGGGMFLEGGTLSITNSTISGNTAGTSGGGLYIEENGPTAATISSSGISQNSAAVGGGIYSLRSTLTITGSTISQNSAGAAGVGGGVYLEGGTLSSTNSTISGNAASTNGGGVYIEENGPTTATFTGTTILQNSTGASGAGGGIRISEGGDGPGGLTVFVTVTNSTITGNAAALGGGIYSNYNNATLTVSSSTISGNTADYGGGIVNQGPLTVMNSTIEGNTATTGEGGGIFNLVGSSLTISNSTISGNAALRGGGIINGAALTVTNSTISGNIAPTGGGGIFNAGTMTVRSTIVAGNTGGDVAGSFAAGSTHNLIQNAASAGGLTNGVNGNLVGVNPLLGVLADNGGPTRTHALLAGSPAISAGINPDSLATDQRGTGFSRSRGTGIDIGAFEFSANPTIASLTPSASSVTRGQSLTLTANTVADADGTIARVDFYRDANANGIADAGELIGSDSDSAGGYTFAFNSAGAALGSLTFLAVAVDNDAGLSTIRSASVMITNAVPTLGTLLSSVSSVPRGQSFTLTANGPADADGTIARVDFYRDVNTNGIADNGELIGSDSESAGGYTFVFNSAGAALGSATFLAVAVDNDAGRSSPRSTSVTVTNAVPTIAGLTASAATLENGDPLTLTAGGVADPDGTVAGVSFFADTNANGVADADELLGTDADAAGGYTYTLTPAQTLALPSAQVIFLAVATDSNAATSAPNSAAATFALSSADQFIQNYLAAPKAVSGLVDGDAIVDSLMSSVSNVAVSDAYWGARNHWFQDKRGDVWSLWQGGDVHLSQTLAGQHEWVLTNLTDAAGLSGTMRFAPGSLSGVTTGWNAFNIQGIQDGTLVALWWSPAGSAGTYVDTDGSTKQGSASGLRGNGWSLSSISDALTSIGGAVTTPAGAFLAYSHSQSNGRTEFDPRPTFLTANTGMAVVVVDANQRVYVISFSVSQREIPRADPGLNARWVIEPLAEIPSIADFGLTDQLSTFEQDYVTAATR